MATRSWSRSTRTSRSRTSRTGPEADPTAAVPAATGRRAAPARAARRARRPPSRTDEGYSPPHRARLRPGSMRFGWRDLHTGPRVVQTRMSAEAFDALVRRYRAPLIAYCGRLLDRDRAEDVVQQVFLDAYLALE